MGVSSEKTTDIPQDNECKIHFRNGGYTIIPKLNRDNFVRLNAWQISYIEDGGSTQEPLPEVNMEAPIVEQPSDTPDPGMSWSKKKLLKHAKKVGIEYDDEKSVTKTEILSDILTQKP